MDHFTASLPSRSVHVIWVLLALAIVWSLWRGQFATVFVSVGVLVLSVLPFLLQRHYRIYVPDGFVTASVLFVYATLFLGEVGDFYERFWWWDVVLHTGSAVGFGLIAFIVLWMVVGERRMRQSPVIMSVFACCAAISIGAVWEIFEFGMDQVFGMHMQKSGLVDTMWDLIVDSIGALVAAAAGYRYARRSVDGSLTRLIDETITHNQS